MLEKPDIPDEQIIAGLHNNYRVQTARLAFLPLGADLNTAVYRVESTDGSVYFLKLRSGDFNEASVTVPSHLSRLGIRQIIPPLTTQSGLYGADLPPFTAILYPYVEGQDGFERNLTDRQWVEFGAAMKRFHSAIIPESLTRGVVREDFSPRWCNAVRVFQERIREESFAEPVAREMAAFLKKKRDEVLRLIERTEQLAHKLRGPTHEFILCHADIHAWNLLVVDEDTFYMVDWDTLVFAPKERDLMFIGAGFGGNGHTPQEEETLFYRGYGRTRIDQAAISYYRYNRIVEDIAIYCEQIFLSDEGGEDREQGLEYLKSNFLPGGTIEMARQSDKAEG